MYILFFDKLSIVNAVESLHKPHRGHLPNTSIE